LSIPEKSVERQSEASEHPNRQDRRRTETHERLFEAAMQLLTERDFEAVTVEMITEAADVGKGTFFYHFPNKEEVVSYFFAQQLQLLTEMLHAPLTAYVPNDEERTPPEHRPDATQINDALMYGGPIWQRIVATTLAVSARDAESKRRTRNLLALGLVNPLVRINCLGMREQVTVLMDKMISEGQASGEFRTDIESARLSRHMIDVFLAVLTYWSQADSEDSLADCLRSSYELLWSSIRRTA